MAVSTADIIGLTAVTGAVQSNWESLLFAALPEVKARGLPAQERLSEHIGLLVLTFCGLGDSSGLKQPIQLNLAGTPSQQRSLLHTGDRQDRDVVTVSRRSDR